MKTQNTFRGIGNNISEMNRIAANIHRKARIKKTIINALISLSILAAFYLIVGSIIYYGADFRPF